MTTWYNVNFNKKYISINDSSKRWSRDVKLIWITFCCYDANILVAFPARVDIWRLSWGCEGQGMNPWECEGVTIDSISRSREGVYESLTLSTATKSHICRDLQLLESFTDLQKWFDLSAERTQRPSDHFWNEIPGWTLKCKKLIGTLQPLKPQAKWTIVIWKPQTFPCSTRFDGLVD